MGLSVSMKFISLLVVMSVVADAAWSRCVAPEVLVRMENAEQVFSAEILENPQSPEPPPGELWVMLTARVLHGWKNTPQSPVTVKYSRLVDAPPRKGDKLIFFTRADGDAVTPVFCSQTYYDTGLYERAILGKPEVGRIPWEEVDLPFLRNALDREELGNPAMDALKRLPGGHEVIFDWAATFPWQRSSPEEVADFLSLFVYFPSELLPLHSRQISELALSPRSAARLDDPVVYAQLVLLRKHGTVHDWFSIAKRGLISSDYNLYRLAAHMMIGQLQSVAYAEEAEAALRTFADSSDAFRLSRGLLYQLSQVNDPSERAISLLCDYGSEDMCQKANEGITFPDDYWY